jgi:LmbE family N-acetylglucosaminyl deacetylase
MVVKRVLGVFAHPDDEVFCCGGTLAKYAARGAETVVVSATRGEAGQIRDATLATRATLAQVRERELRAACECLGVGHVRFFDHIDGTLCDLDRDALLDQVIGVLDDVRPDVVITFGADGAYGHPDHVTIGQVTTDAFLSIPRGALYHSHFPRSRLLLVDRLAHWLAELNERFKGPSDFARAFSLFAQETRTLGYAGDELEVAWFPPGVFIVEQGEPATSLFLILSGFVDVIRDQPDGSRATLRRQGPGEFFGELALARNTTRTAHVVAAESVTCLVFSPGTLTAYAGRGGISNLSAAILPDAESMGAVGPATTVVDVSDFVDRKLAAIAAHRTQYPIDPDMFPQWMALEMMGREYFARVYPPVEPEDELFGG